MTAEKLKRANLRSGSGSFKMLQMFTGPQCQLRDEEIRNLLVQCKHPSAPLAA